MMAYYLSYKYIPAYSHVVGKAYSTSCEDMRINKSLPCEDSNYDCATAGEVWEGTDLKCQQGRYVPPQCEGNNSVYCQEILGTSVKWSLGFWEQVLNYTKLNFTFANMGVQIAFLLELCCFPFSQKHNH